MITFNLIQPNDDREKRGENAGKVLLNAENLRKSYGKGEARVDALADVSLQIYEGELLTILGGSGRVFKMRNGKITDVRSNIYNIIHDINLLSLFIILPHNLIIL